MANILVKFNSALTDLISWANLRARHLGWSEESKGLWFKRPLSEAEDDPGEPILIPSTIGQGMGRRYTKTAHGFSVGNAIRYSGGEWVLASAAAFESLATHVVVRVLDANRFDADSSGGWDIGIGVVGPVYLSSTVPGALTGTRPTTGAIQVVGVGIAGVTWITLSPGDGTLQLDVTKGAPALPGGIGWNADDGVAEINQGGGVVLQIGQESQVPVRNVTGATLLNGKVGILTGSSGERPTAALASVASLATSKALGVFTQDIANNQIGKMSTFGLVREIPLNFPEGTEVFLSEVDGGLSATPAPGTRVRIGIVVRSHASNGTLFVSIDRTPLLAELPDVDMTGVTSSDILMRGVDGVWRPAKIADANVAAGAAVAWNKISKTGAVPGDVGAEPAITAGTSAQYITGAKGLADFGGAVRAAVLTGLSTATNAVISATDTVLQAMGKLQAQISAKEPTIATGAATSFWAGNKTWVDFSATARAVVLTGLSTATSTVVTAADTILQAIGKLQAQVSLKLPIDNPVFTGNMYGAGSFIWRAPASDHYFSLYGASTEFGLRDLNDNGSTLNYPFVAKRGATGEVQIGYSGGLRPIRLGGTVKNDALAGTGTRPAVALTDGTLSYQDAATFRETIGAAAAVHTHATTDLRTGVDAQAGGLLMGSSDSAGQPIVYGIVPRYGAADGGPWKFVGATWTEMTPGSSSDVWLGDWTTGKITNSRVADGAAIAWSKISKTGATAGDVDALPDLVFNGAIDFGSINGGLPGVYALQGTSWTDGWAGITNGQQVSLLQMQGASGMMTQIAVDHRFGGMLLKFQASEIPGDQWSPWYQIWDSGNLPVGSVGRSVLATTTTTAARAAINAAEKPGQTDKSGSWTLDANTPMGVRQTSSGTLTLPAASATYAAKSYVLTASTNLTLTIAGTFSYLDANNSASYWYDTASSVAFAMNGGHASGYRKKIEIWCDGAEWLVKC